MRRYRYIILILIVAVMSLYGFSEAKGAQAVDAARSLVMRTAPKLAKQVSFCKGNGEEITVSAANDGNGILITAPDAARMIYGYGQYLKRSGGHLSWNGSRLPDILPVPKTPVKIAPSPWSIRFAYNYCALSYTAAFRGWKEWERELDFLAMQGISHVLVTAGLEKTWALFLEGLGADRAQTERFIAHPAYAAWWHMGNIQGMGGPVTRERIEGEAKLGKKIAARAHELGMTPVLQGYVGFLPHDYKAEQQKDFHILPQGNWVNGTRPSVLDPNCGGFRRTAALWYDCLQKVYGFKAKYFAGDLFHEGGNKTGIDEKAAVRSVQQAMQEASPNSVWVLQSWHANPSDAFLEALNPDRSLILRLVKNMSTGDSGFRDFRGIPWLWCELSNFGGKTGLYGGLPMMCRLGKSLEAEKSRGMVGLGLNSEGTESNPIYFDFFFSRLATDEEWNLEEQLRILAKRRYGYDLASLRNALGLLAHSIYSPPGEQEGGLETILCARPSWDVAKASTWSSPRRYYDTSVSLKAVRSYLQALDEKPALAGSKGFLYDLVDVTRQAAADAFYDYLQKIRVSFDARNAEEYDKMTARFLDMMTDLDVMLATQPQFRLGTWVGQARARAKGKNKEHEAVLAKTLITTWCGEIQTWNLNDYSNRQWAGLIRDFYRPRWKCFFSWQRKVMTGQADAGAAQEGFMRECSAAELAFARNGKTYSEKTRVTSIAAVKKFVKKYGDLLGGVSNAEAEGGYAWSVAEGNDSFRIDVTDCFMHEGEYEVKLKGNDFPAIRSVELYEGEKPVVTGEKNEGGAWRIRLTQMRTNLDAYTLLVRFEAPVDRRCRGTVSAEKKN